MKRSTVINLLIVLAIAALAVIPLLVRAGDDKEAQFGGSDAEGQTAITENDPDYEPWFSPIFEPPSTEVASGLFALQAALGGGLLGYYFGVVRTKRKLATANTED